MKLSVLTEVVIRLTEDDVCLRVFVMKVCKRTGDEGVRRAPGERENAGSWEEGVWRRAWCILLAWTREWVDGMDLLGELLA
ncbi:hypothetical protein KSC_102610 [Ktedonobacter sp. SOSP1-52]|nr:hypothetical protein KSC_102610 [Ktedonobacter sp. SOSP1-52]